MLATIHRIITERGRASIAALITSPWAVAFWIFTATELGLDLLRPPLQSRHGLFYALSIASSLAFWLLLSRLLDSMASYQRRWVAAACAALLSTSLLIATAMTFKMFGQFITRDMIGFIGNDPRYFVDFILSLMVGWRLPAYVAGIGLMTLVWRPRGGPESYPRHSGLKNVVIIVSLALFAVGSLVTVGLSSKNYHHRIETSFLWAIPHAIADSVTQRARLHSAQRMKVEPLTSQERAPWSVLFIYNESLAGESLFERTGNSYAHTEAMPRLRGWLEAEQARTVIFQNAYTNSGATNVSIPSLFTGVAPEASLEALHEAPLPWHWAKAAGLRSIMVTAQRYSWANFDAFFFSFPPDIYLTAATLDAPVVNDTGIDDMVAAAALVEQLEAIPLEQPVLAIYGTNAAHYPFQEYSEHVELPAGLSRHARSLRIVDHAIDRVLTSLQRSGRLDRTIVIMTSDHGALPAPRHVPRLYSFYDEIARVPMLIRLPEALIAKQPAWLNALRANQGSLVQNMDLMPTLAGLLQLDQSPQNRQILAHISGQSLLEPVPQDRTLVMLNTNDIRSWETEGFGLFFNRDLRFVFTNIAGPQLFDISRDPEQTHNLWPAADTETRAHVMRLVESNRHLRRIFESGANSASH